MLRPVTRAMTANDERGYHAAALTRGLTILEEFARSGRPLGLPELHTGTELPKSTLVRLLAVLQDLGYVIRVDERPTYWLGPAVMPLADAYADALDLSAYATTALAALAERTGHTANLGVLDGADVVHLAVAEPERALRFRATTGSRDGAYRTGLGKVLLAHVAADALGAHLPPEPFPARTDHTLTTRAELERELATIRRRGYAVDNGEGDRGVGCLAVPLAIGGEVMAAVSVTGPLAELTGAAQRPTVAVLTETVRALAQEPQLKYALSLARRALS